MLNRFIALIGVVLLSGSAMADTTIVGGSISNANFNANPNDSQTFVDTPDWQNLGAGGQGTESARTNLDYDSSPNAVLSWSEIKIFGLDTGYTIAEGDAFSIGYVWRDAWNWDDGSDEVRVSLFVTDDNTITNTRTVLVPDLSGISTINGSYEAVDHDNIYMATAGDAGKILFVAIDTTCASNEYARLDNFELTVGTPNIYYVAASGNNSNDGLSPATAWRDVDALDGKTFFPGEQILFNCGDTFSGATTLLGSGSASGPIVIGAYGTGDKPLLTGDSAEAAIFRLTDNEYIEFQDLRMSNYNTSNASVLERQVIVVEPPAGSGEINHLHFRNLDVFDVQGYGKTDPEEDHRSYAIFLATVDNDTSPTRFNDVLCENCTFAGIDGRAFTINDPSRSLADWRNSGTPYYPSINCAFQDNYGTNIYRNMAMVSGTQGFLVQGNTMDTTVEGSAFWPFNAEGTVVQHNLFMNIFAYDADGYVCHFDYNCIDTLMQYNVGINVEGGLIEILRNTASWSFQEGAIARYNIGIDVGWRNHTHNGAGIFLTGAVKDSQVYNNTIVQLSRPQYKAISFNNWGGGWPTNSAIYNNIFYAADTASTYHEIIQAHPYSGLNNVIDNNLYYGNIVPPQTWHPWNVDLNAYTGNPLFANPSGLTAEDFKVTYGSAAIATGRLIAANGGFDYFGNAVSAVAAPTIGAHEYQTDATIDSDGDAMFDLWETGYGLNPGNATDAMVHSDSDSLVNLVEFALGGNPLDGNDTGHPQSWSKNGSDMAYVYPRRIGSTLSYWLETCDNLVSNNWVDSGYTELPETGAIDADFESVTNTVPVIGSQGFVRLRVEGE